MSGVLHGGWGYVAAAYLTTASALLTYFATLAVRLRR